MLALLLQSDEGGGGFGVLAVLVILVLLFFVLNSVWRQDKRRKAAREKALADRLLKRIYQTPGEPVNLTRLARQEHIREAVVKEICEGKLVKEGYLLWKQRPKKDQVERLFLSPAGIEAMKHRTDQST